MWGEAGGLQFFNLVCNTQARIKVLPTHPIPGMGERCLFAVSLHKNSSR